jgi:hypothetical protein
VEESGQQAVCRPLGNGWSASLQEGMAEMEHTVGI